mgnify:CR=1 FL=1
MSHEETLILPNQLGTAVLCMPTNAKPKACVIVVHEWWGLNDYAKGRAKKLADLGYAAIAVDMYGHGKIADDPKEAEEMMNTASAEPEKLNARFQEARKLLAQHCNVAAESIYAVGYCFGGAVVLNQARLGTELAGVASFHGLLETDHPARAGNINTKLLIATGGADPMVGPDSVAAFVKEMQTAEAEFHLMSFPNVKHGFTNPTSTEIGKKYGMPLFYDEHADVTSWDSLLDFMR